MKQSRYRGVVNSKKQSRKRRTPFLLLLFCVVFLTGCQTLTGSASKKSAGDTVGSAAGVLAEAESGNAAESSSASRGWSSIPEGAEAQSLTPAEEDTKTQEEQEAESTEEEESDSADPQEAEVTTTQMEDLGSAMTGTEEAKELVKAFMQERGLNSSNFAVAYENLVTGEVFYYNELKQWDACSTYKLPLNLLYYDMETAGTITGDTIVPGTTTPLSECHHQSLEFSNNELSEAMMDNLGSYDVVKQNMRKYFTLSDAEIDSSYYHHNYFCARMMMDCAAYLYQHQSEYADALGYLKAAQPGEYFKAYISDVTIAQKYGLRDGYNHNAGIVFAQTPFALSVYSYQAGGGEMIGRVAELFYRYSNS